MDGRVMKEGVVGSEGRYREGTSSNHHGEVVPVMSIIQL